MPTASEKFSGSGFCPCISRGLLTGESNGQDAVFHGSVYNQRKVKIIGKG